MKLNTFSPLQNDETFIFTGEIADSCRDHHGPLRMLREHNEKKISNYTEIHREMCWFKIFHL